MDGFGFRDDVFVAKTRVGNHGEGNCSYDSSKKRSFSMPVAFDARVFRRRLLKNDYVKPGTNLAHQPVSVLGVRHDGRGGSPAFRVGDDGGGAAFHGGDLKETRKGPVWSARVRQNQRRCVINPRRNVGGVGVDKHACVRWGWVPFVRRGFRQPRRAVLPQDAGHRISVTRLALSLRLCLRRLRARAH